jgi:uncharacterized protein
MIKKRIFLASSMELKEDREQFEIFINRKNKEWTDKGIFLDLIVWEDFLDAVSQTRLQDEYDKAIRECDIFVMLFATRVGKYTEEEFETAFGQFRATAKPFIFAYFKDTQISTGSANQDDLMSLWAFQKKLEELGHFHTVYKNIDELKFKFNQQLEKLAARGDVALTQSQKSAGFQAYNPESKRTLEGGEASRAKRRTDPRDLARAKLERIPLPYTADAFVQSAENGNLAVVKLFLAAGIDPNAKHDRDSYRDTALMYAAGNGHIEIVKTLIKAKANVNERNNKPGDQPGSTALNWAVSGDKADIVRFLLDHGADADSVNKSCWSAAQNGYLEVLRMLLEHGVDKEHLNPSLVVASDRSPEATYNEVVLLLLQHGADVNAKDVNECTALQACCIAGSVAIVQTLLDAGADPSAKPRCDWRTHEKGWTPLMLALKYAGEPKDRAIAGLLMSHGANPDLTSDEGTTTLMVAASDKNNIDMVRALLDKGADPNQVNNSGKTALMAASGSEGNTSMVELLLNRGADVNLADENGMTALINASWERNNAPTIRLLLERGANPNAKARNNHWDKDKITALMWTASLPQTGGEVPNVEALLDAGVDLHARSEKGRTALMLAIREGNIETTQALLRRGAKVDDEDMVAKTPLNYAEEYSGSEFTRADMIRILKKAGAK